MIKDLTKNILDKLERHSSMKQSYSRVYLPISISMLEKVLAQAEILSQKPNMYTLDKSIREESQHDLLLFETAILFINE